MSDYLQEYSFTPPEHVHIKNLETQNS